MAGAYTQNQAIVESKLVKELRKHYFPRKKKGKAYRKLLLLYDIHMNISSDMDLMTRALFNALRGTGAIKTKTISLRKYIGEGLIELCKRQYLLWIEDTGKPVETCYLLKINGVDQEELLYESEKKLLSVFDKKYKKLKYKDLGELGYYERIETCMVAFHKLFPKGSPYRALKHCQRWWNADTINEVRYFPENMGIQYALYLKSIEGRETRYIKSLDNFVKDGDFLLNWDFDSIEINLTDLESHQEARNLLNSLR